MGHLDVSGVQWSLPHGRLSSSAVAVRPPTAVPTLLRSTGVGETVRRRIVPDRGVPTLERTQAAFDGAAVRVERVR